MTQKSDNRHGFRGYITSKPFMGERAPQHIQNLVIRDYASRNGLTYLLSSSEYAMAGSQMILDQVLLDLDRLEGVICYSIFQLPVNRTRRRVVYDKIIEAGCSLHSAVEGLVVRTADDAGHVESIWRVRQTLASCPDAKLVQRVLQAERPGTGRDKSEFV